MQEFALDAFTKLDTLVIIIIKSPYPVDGDGVYRLSPGFINAQIALIRSHIFCFAYAGSSVG